MPERPCLVHLPPPPAFDGPPAPPQRVSRWGAVLVHGLGVVLTGGAIGVGVVVMVVASFGTSYCGSAPAAAQVRDLQLWTAATFLAVAAVPAFWAFLCRSSRIAWTAWAGIAGVLVAVGVLATISAQPSHWCF